MDVYLISRIFADFVTKGYIDEALLLEQSARYMTFHQSAPKPANTGHPLLPLDILVPPSMGEKILCATCSRSLSLQCFPKPARGLGGDRNCFVCRAVNLNKAERAAKKAADKRPASSQPENPGAAVPSMNRSSRSRYSSGHHRPHGISDWSSGIIYPDADGKVEIFGYDDEETPGGTYLRDMYDSD